MCRESDSDRRGERHEDNDRAIYIGGDRESHHRHGESGENRGDAPTIELVFGYNRSNRSALLKRFLARANQLIAGAKPDADFLSVPQSKPHACGHSRKEEGNHVSCGQGKNEAPGSRPADSRAGRTERALEAAYCRSSPRCVARSAGSWPRPSMTISAAISAAMGVRPRFEAQARTAGADDLIEIVRSYLK
jgi:hypothetical protein